MRIAIISEVFLPKIDGVVNRTVHLILQLVRAGDLDRVFRAFVDKATGGKKAKGPEAMVKTA